MTTGAKPLKLAVHRERRVHVWQAAEDLRRRTIFSLQVSFSAQRPANPIQRPGSGWLALNTREDRQSTVTVRDHFRLALNANFPPAG
jgi:hypothetical protein